MSPRKPSNVGSNPARSTRQTSRMGYMPRTPNVGWMKRLGESREKFLSDPDIAAWHDNTARGSPLTAEVHRRSLSLFCALMQTDAKTLLKLQEKELHTLLLKFVSHEEKRGQAGSSTQTHIKAVRSWLNFNGIHLSRPVKVRGAQETPSIAKERVPTQDELRRIFLAATPRNRVSAVLMAHAGLRPEVLGNYLGKEGLRLKDLPDLRLGKGKVEFEQTPAQVIVRSELSKTRRRYFTFLSEEGCEYVRTYLEERISLGEALTPETDLLHGEADYKKSFVHTINLSDGVRKAIRAVMGKEVKMRPYTLRAYFDTQMHLAESKGKIPNDYRVFWMGHRGSMDARYTTNKGRLPPDILKDMREAYQRAEPFLSTAQVKEGNLSPQGMETMARALGLTDEGAGKQDWENMEPSRFIELVRGLTKSAPLPPQQRLVGVDELPRLLSDGWTVVTAVNGQQVVVSSPSTLRAA